AARTAKVVQEIGERSKASAVAKSKRTTLVEWRTLARGLLQELRSKTKRVRAHGLSHRVLNQIVLRGAELWQVGRDADCGGQGTLEAKVLQGSRLLSYVRWEQELKVDQAIRTNAQFIRQGRTHRPSMREQEIARSSSKVSRKFRGNSNRIRSSDV